MILYIDSVDGETLYSIQTAAAHRALEFLAKYDHEGSSIFLKADHNQGPIDNPDRIYAYLKEHEGE